ncbi:MAG TPA: azurin [Oligoflexus sp.]|uniref:azurin n=1 Tax=Oligoflexus sp. TaxID=1971216 RepID=UPI002D65D497|nr:azurin [Oligoflexus sp.]HYX37438.1 azurin [Oligoflexus sp.]
MKMSLMALAFAGFTAQTALAVDCTITLSGNDQMQYDKKEIKLPAECATSDIKIDFKHIGKLPAAAMGHNVVLIENGKLPTIQTRYAAAGADPAKIDANSEQLKTGGEVIAYTKIVGGGAADSTVIPKNKLKAGEKYQYFCSFPGHFALMTGTLEIEKAAPSTAAATTDKDKKADKKK